MKKMLLTALACVVSLTMNAQIVKWMVTPEYDGVRLLDNGLLEVCQNDKYGLLDDNGVAILPIAYDSIGAFVNGQALLFNNSQFVGFVNTAGEKVDVASDYTLVPDMDFFSDGFLPVKKGTHYYYLNNEGQAVSGPFAEIKPYFNGYAAVVAYDDFIKNPKEVNNAYIDKSQILAYIREYGKKDVLKRDDLSFISSFRDGRAVYVYKRKAYFVNAETLVSTPVVTDSLQPKKTHVQFDKNIEPTPFEDGYLLKSKSGYLYFNRFMQLDKIEDAGVNLYIYNKPDAKDVDRTTDVTAFGNTGSMGVKYKGDVILPEQFADVIPLGGQRAVVQSGDKWGVIEIDTKNQFIIKLNNNEHIGFNHRYYTTKLTASMPSDIKCCDATLISKSKDCEIKIESRSENDNVERNTLTYDCRLAIPSNLSDTLMTHNYVFAIKYNGFTSIDYTVSIPEWYVKYYEVKLSNNHFSISPSDIITVEFDLVKTDIARDDKTNYFKTVELSIPGVGDVPLNKITENHYAFRVGGIDCEKLKFVVKITEVGCPAIEYPFEMVFEKPENPTANSQIGVSVNQIRPVTSLQLPSTANTDSVAVPIIMLQSN